jgi:hypothetical protein
MRRKSARNNCARVVNDKRVARTWWREALANTSRASQHRPLLHA